MLSVWERNPIISVQFQIPENPKSWWFWYSKSPSERRFWGFNLQMIPIMILSFSRRVQKIKITYITLIWRVFHFWSSPKNAIEKLTFYIEIWATRIENAWRNLSISRWKLVSNNLLARLRAHSLLYFFLLVRHSLVSRQDLLREQAVATHIWRGSLCSYFWWLLNSVLF